MLAATVVEDDDDEGSTLMTVMRTSGQKAKKEEEEEEEDRLRGNGLRRRRRRGLSPTLLIFLTSISPRWSTVARKDQENATAGFGLRGLGFRARFNVIIIVMVVILPSHSCLFRLLHVYHHYITTLA